MGEVDGILSDSGMANFYLYRRMSDNRFSFLVWDKEMTFVSQTWPILQYTEDNVLLRRALLVPELHKVYLDTLHLAAEVAEGPGGWLAREIDRQYTQIHQAVLNDPNRVCFVDGKFIHCPSETFEAAVDYARGFARERASFVSRSLEEAGWAQGPQAPDLIAGAAVNAASGVAFLSPGQLVAVQVDLPLNDAERAENWPLPEELGGVSVAVSDVKTPLILAMPAGVWFQTPYELPCGPGSLTVSDGGGASHTIAVEIRPANPGVFVVTHANGKLLDTDAPAEPGEVVTAWVTGLGHAVGGERTGRPAPLDRLVEMQNPVSAAVNGKPAFVLWAGLAPGLAGLQQVILQLPGDVSGPLAVLSLTVLGEPGAGYWLAIR